MKTSLIAAVLIIAAGPGFAVIDFDDGQVHNIDYAINDHVRVDFQSPGKQTTLNLLDGGSIGDGYTLTAYEDSRINMSNGSAVYGFLYIRDYSQAEISGIVRDEIRVMDNSEVNFEDFASPGIILIITDNSLVTMSDVSLSYLDDTDLVFSSTNPMTIYGSNFAINGSPVGLGMLTAEFLAGFSGPTILTCCGGALNIPISLAGGSSIFLAAGDVSKPVIQPNGGTFVTPQKVTLSSSVSYGKIYYTTDGSEPDESSSLYGGSPFTLSNSSTVKAKVITNDTESKTASAIFKIGPVISGYIKTAGGTAVSDVTITGTNSGGTAKTNSKGYYALRVPYNWSGSVRPTKTNWTLSPLSRTYSSVKSSKTSQNFTIYGNPKISGFIKTPGGTAISGAIVTASNNGGIATTSTSGYYSLRVPYNWKGTVKASKTYFSWSPSAKTYTSAVKSSKTSQNFTAYAWPKISGYVKTYEGTPISGVSVYASGSKGTTDANGYYAFRVRYNWTSSIRPDKPDYFFEPRLRSYTAVKSSKSSQNFTGYLIP